MRAFNLGAVRRALYASAVLTLLSVPSLAQVVEKGRTFADLTASHPCDTGLTERIARVTDCDAADDVGDGEGLFQCWVRCDGTAPWETVAIGGGAGGGSGDVVGPASAIDGQVAVQSGTTGKLLANSGLIAAATTGDLQWEGTTADAFEGNFTFADPTADWTWAWGADGALTGPSLVVSGKTIVFGDPTQNGDSRIVVSSNVFQVKTGDDLYYQTFRAGTLQSYHYDGSASVVVRGDDQSITPSTGILKISSTLHLAPLASPPRTCDATAEGDIYSDTSHSLCWCDGSTWQKLSGAGTCA